MWQEAFGIYGPGNHGYRIGADGPDSRGYSINTELTPGTAVQYVFLNESGNLFRGGVFLDFVRRSGTTRAEGPHGGASHVRRAKRN